MLWKSKAPLRCIITMWLALNSKLLTWDIGLKQGWISPNRCILCKENAKSTSHLFMSCSYAVHGMSIIKDKLNAKATWRKESLEECLKEWVQD
jgi:hypothetical protein